MYPNANAINNDAGDSDSESNSSINGQPSNEQMSTSSGSSSRKSSTGLSPKTSMINDNIIIIESPPPVEGTKPPEKTAKFKSKSTDNGGTSVGRAGATVRSLSDDELPDPETVKRVKDAFEAMAQKNRANAEVNKPPAGIGRSKSMIVLTGRAWCNGGGGNIYHRHGACSSVLSCVRAVSPEPKTVKRPPLQRSCSELDQYFHERADEREPVSWESHDSDQRGSPVSAEVIARIRQHGTCVKFFGAEAQAISSDNEWGEFENDYDDYYHELHGGSQRDGYLLNYPLVHDHKPKIIGAIPKSANSTGSGSSCASSTFDDYDNSSGSASPYPWLNLDRLRAVFGGDETDNFRQSNGSVSSSSSHPTSPFEGNGYGKALKGRNNEDEHNNYQLYASKLHGVWRKNPSWPGSYYVIYDFNLPKDDVAELNGYSQN